MFRVAPLSAAALLLLAPAATADCITRAESFLMCTVNGGAKELRGCWGPGDAGYQYGPAGGEPELVLSVPLTQLDYIPWAGVGSSIWEEVNYHNGDVQYSVWHRIDRDPGGDPPSAGVTVTRGEETLADLQCDPGSISANYQGLYEAKAEIGQCWQDFSWQSCAEPAASPAPAACQPGSRPFLACTTGRGAKQVAGCVGPNGAHYSYGPAGAAPELALTAPLDGFEYTPAAQHPAGQSIATFWNGKTGYALWASSSGAGVEVVQGDSALAVLDCDPGSSTVDFGALDAALAAENLCFGGFLWSRCTSP
ncbi:hypothetical protein FHY55_15055 [Oceanicola sp. D3]|uniref:hypothetical protein n=1 Tax=Oceanicola sp. D3 TaxID=2587163 RepID=UPI00111ECF23|nr:hypothetical protein [Oceanicola sp. D3]QDC10478.1 hypothetical protein FHY55_15055 [Oceanicola sp. D3]